MNNIPEPLNQKVLFDSEEIFQCITAQLQNAKSEILVATAWLTDPELFQSLLTAVDRGVDARIIIADNDDNRKLDFEKLAQLGAMVYKIGQPGNRSMRKRFCVVDRATAIHGSYYWSVSARVSNQESVIVTNHTDTVQSLIDEFNEMQQLAVNSHNETGFKTTARSTEPGIEKQRHNYESLPVPNKLNFQAAYAAVLDRMIAAEVCNFDRSLLRQQGYDRAEANNGDAQVLSSAMDSVYAVFINDIDIVEDKKKRLIGKINEQEIIQEAVLENYYQAELRTVETQAESTQQETITRITNLKAKADVCKLDIAAIKDQKVIAAELAAEEITAHINRLEQKSVIPRFKWYEFVPVVILSIGLLSYLFLFYSSAVYILLFSEIDAKTEQMEGTVIEPPQVFDPHAISKILAKGNYALGFLLLFVFIPVTVSVIRTLAKESIFNKGWFRLLIIVLLDGFIACKVASAIHEIDYLSGKVTTAWRFGMAFTEVNFYLVFVLGALGLFIFDVLFHKLISLLEDRNPDVLALQIKQEKEQQRITLDRNRVYIAELKETADKYTRELIQINNDIHLLEISMTGLPHKKSLAIENCLSETVNAKKMLNDITIVYIAHIENDILPISIDSMKDRIAVFLEGWTTFLNNEYAEVKAIEKSRQAIEAAMIWQQQKLSGNRIDNRIKAL
jgi:hypothetical protein